MPPLGDLKVAVYSNEDAITAQLADGMQAVDIRQYSGACSALSDMSPRQARLQSCAEEDYSDQIFRYYEEETWGLCGYQQAVLNRGFS